MCFSHSFIEQNLHSNLCRRAFINCLIEIPKKQHIFCVQININSFSLHFDNRFVRFAVLSFNKSVKMDWIVRNILIINSYLHSTSYGSDQYRNVIGTVPQLSGKNYWFYLFIYFFITVNGIYGERRYVM